MEPAHSRAFEVITFVPFDGGDGKGMVDARMNKPASAKCITRFLTPDETFPSPALFFFFFLFRANEGFPCRSLSNFSKYFETITREKEG